MFVLAATVWVICAGVQIGILHHLYPTEQDFKRRHGGDGMFWFFAHPVALIAGPFGLMCCGAAWGAQWVLIQIFPKEEE